MTEAGHAAFDENAFETATYRKVAWRLVPLLFLGYFVAFLDRVNVGFAKLQMAGDLQFSDEVYGFGAGVFFIGYFLFELPSNLILARVGARRWLARIAITWSLASAAFMFTGAIAWGPVSAAFGCTDAQFTFYLLRFILGIAEAGFVPGAVYCLTLWFPSARRAQVMALFFIAIPLASAIGSPISGAILQFLDGAQGLRGWQWLFLVEALPSLTIGIVILAILPDGPRSARWLSEPERALIIDRLAADERGKASLGQRSRIADIFSDWRVWALALADFCRAAYSNALNFWMPTIVQEIGIDKRDYFAVGLVAAIPWGLGAIIMVLVSRRSDRVGERKWHATIASLVAAAGLLMLAFGGRQPVLSIVALTMVAGGGLAWLAVFWTLPTAFLSGTAAAGGIAWINALAMLGGYVGPDTLGRIRGANGGEDGAAFLILALLALLGTGLSYVLAGRKAKSLAAA
ncbi:MAG: MFS transporter [Sphingobium sp.]|nr:MFS transporter [Sphingobium sp.]